MQLDIVFLPWDSSILPNDNLSLFFVFLSKYKNKSKRRKYSQECILYFCIRKYRWMDCNLIWHVWLYFCFFPSFLIIDSFCPKYIKLDGETSSSLSWAYRISGLCSRGCYAETVVYKCGQRPIRETDLVLLLSTLWLVKLIILLLEYI